jgi:hypothetical protein
MGITQLLEVCLKPFFCQRLSQNSVGVPGIIYLSCIPVVINVIYDKNLQEKEFATKLKDFLKNV